MKKLALILISFLVFACADEAVPKPDHLLNEGQMVDILYDISILQAIKSLHPQVLEEGKVDAKYYVYKKYSIDSLTFAKNQAYYASNLVMYESIQTKLTDRIKKQKEALTKEIKLIEEKEGKKLKDKNSAKTDSLSKKAVDTFKVKKVETVIK